MDSAQLIAVDAKNENAEKSKNNDRSRRKDTDPSLAMDLETILNSEQSYRRNDHYTDLYRAFFEKDNEMNEDIQNDNTKTLLLVGGAVVVVLALFVTLRK